MAEPLLQASNGNGALKRGLPAPKLRRSDVYARPLLDGARPPTGALSRARDRLRSLTKSSLERQELELERALRGHGEVTRANLVAVASPKGGVGKTSVTFLAGNLLAAHLKLRVLAIDASAEPGTLGALVPDRLRSPLSVVDLIADLDQIHSTADLQIYVSRLPSGLHVLAGGDRADLLEPSFEDYARLLAFARRHYELILLDLGAGMASEFARLSLTLADHTLLVTTPEWVTAQSVTTALSALRCERTTLVMNRIRPDDAGEGRVVESHFRRQEIGQRVALPDDARLAAMLDSGTYSLEALPGETRLAVKRLGLAVARGLV